MKMRGMGVAEIETSPFWGHSSPSGLDEDRHNAFRVVVRPWSCVFCSRFYFVALNLTVFSGVQVSTGCGRWFRVSFIRIPSAIQMFEAGGPWRGSAGTPGVFTRYNGMQLVTGMYICTQYVSTSKYRCAKLMFVQSDIFYPKMPSSSKNRKRWFMWCRDAPKISKKYDIMGT